VHVECKGPTEAAAAVAVTRVIDVGFEPPTVKFYLKGPPPPLKQCVQCVVVLPPSAQQPKKRHTIHS
jgi:hypothetical protein